MNECRHYQVSYFETIRKILVWKNNFISNGFENKKDYSLMVRWVIRLILRGMDPLSYFSFQPVLHDWCNKGRGMCYPVWDGAYKGTLAVNRKE